MDLTRRSSDKWLIDFMGMEQEEASYFEAPFEYARSTVRPLRLENRDAKRRTHWWRPGRTGEDIRAALLPLSRFIATPRVAKHRLMVWQHRSINPDCQLVAIARDDDTTFGILHSRFHEVWSLRMGTFLGVGNDPRYTPSTTFETFPFPEGLTPDVPASTYAADLRAQAIALAARDLNERREAWLSPPDLVTRVPEIVPGYPDRLIPVDEAAARTLRTRTLTNLYNARPAWLAGLHDRLDAAVATAYGWQDAWARRMDDEAILAALFALNQARAGRTGG